jgi:hypothetical protein
MVDGLHQVAFLAFCGKERMGCCYAIDGRDIEYTRRLALICTIQCNYGSSAEAQSSKPQIKHSQTSNSRCN